MTVSHERFSEFYAALHGHDPFPWQRMLAQRVVEGEWPECLDLPTASGKTACIDIAVFALTCQVDRPMGERSAPRRIFFVVDRRIIVDAAYERATWMAVRLREARNGVLRDAAERLRSLHEGDEPLAVARIRGGVARDDGWVRSPAQPTVITGTVDQLGSRLLFRAYGTGQLSAPIHAALVGNDSLIILDEAHCAVPFFQTAKAVERYSGPGWAEEPIPNPFRVVVMSATLPAEATHVFPTTAERASALDHPVLHRRRGNKPADLAVARKPNPKKGNAGLRAGVLTDDELVLDAADRAVRLAARGSHRIAIMVNRVATAQGIDAQLRAEAALGTDPLDADVVLMTGRMRPLDRDDLVERWASSLQAREEQPTLARPVIVVATQCLEVGADFNFDALITECASLDALRQRFGRLNRFGTVIAPRACVLIRASQVKTEEQIEKLENDRKTEDPIYGNALARTWNWLNAHAEDADGNGDAWRRIDFGSDAMDALFSKDAAERREALKFLMAPAPDAPVMLPGHVDCWAQTAPHPCPDPDVAVFLHGPARGEPDAYVVLRADLDPERRELWLEAVSLCPPTTLEAFSVPLRVARSWLAGEERTEMGGDVEGEAVHNGDLPTGMRRAAVLWRGRQRSVVTDDPAAVRPYDVLVIPAGAPEIESFGDIPRRDGLRVHDLGDRAFLQARDRPMLRVHNAVLEPWARYPAVAALLRWGADEGREEDQADLSILLVELGDAANTATLDGGTTQAAPPRWMCKSAKVLATRREVLRHPDGGYVVTSRARVGAIQRPEEEASADDDDLTSEAHRAVSLREHLDAVAAVALQFGRRCLPDHEAQTVVRAAQLHDLGKADWRFQVMLNRGNEIEALRRGELLAKSDGVPRSLAARKRVRKLARLPEGFRHEMLSVQLAERSADLVGAVDRDLLLHLIASHHGYGRPFAPVVPDDDPPDVDLRSLDVAGGLTATDRLTSVPPHRLESGMADRFWRLIRRYGWWGLAYLEAILRLADWEASGHHVEPLAKIGKPGGEGA